MNGVYLRALAPDAYATRLVDVPPRAGHRLAGRARPRRSTDRPGEDRAARRVRRLRGLPLPRRRAGPVAARRRGSSTRPRLRSTRSSRWTAAAIEAALKQLCDDLGEKPRTVYLPIRVAVTARACLPGSTRASSSSAGRRRSRGCAREQRRRSERARRPRRRGARPDGVDRGDPGAHRRVRRGDRRSAVDPRRPRARRRGPVRDDDRARLPHALALRPDALRGAPASAARWR